MDLSKATQISKSRSLGVLLNSSLLQRKILYSCLAVLCPKVPFLAHKNYDEIQKWLAENYEKSKDIRIYNIYLHDFANAWGCKGKSLIENLYSAIGYDSKTGSSPEIMKLCYKIENNENLKFINVIESVSINREKGIISIALTNSILPYLINLTSYSSIPFKATIGFKSQYSFAMLEYLRINRYPKENYDLSINSLHEILGTKNIKTYEKWTQFKRGVLDKIEIDFAAISGGGYDLKFNAARQKNGRGQPKVTRVLISYNTIGIKKFLATKNSQQMALKSDIAKAKNVQSYSQQMENEYHMQQQKEKDLQDSINSLCV